MTFDNIGIKDLVTSCTKKNIWLYQKNFLWFYHRILLLYEQQNVWLIQLNIWLILPKNVFQSTKICLIQSNFQG